MKHYSRFITLAGGILAFLSFVLPWEDEYESGIEYVQDGEFLPTIVFIVSLVIIVIGIYMLTQQTPRKSRILVFMSSTIGIGCVLLLMLFINPDTSMMGDHPAGMYGIFVTFIGFVLALIGTCSIPKDKEK